MDGLPATLANKDDVPEILVVGGTGVAGAVRWDKSNRDDKKGLPHVYGVGNGAKCPTLEGDSKDGLEERDGTSMGRFPCRTPESW